MNTCEICDDTTAHHYNCALCEESEMCERCACDPQKHYCKYAKIIPSRRKKQLGKVQFHPTRQLVSKRRESTQSLAEYVEGVGMRGSSARQRMLPDEHHSIDS
jgi:hypothetical protein